MQSVLTTPTPTTDKVTVDIIDTAIAAGNFTTLVNAIKAADLVTTLKGAGPFTVFAPSDEAFKKLPAGALDGLLKDRVKLASILKYHVVPGKVMLKDAASGEVKTVLGSSLKAVKDGDTLTLDDAKVTKADIETSNGVIHIIDTVMMPKA